MHTPGLEVDMGWGNHPTSIAGGVLIAVGEARLVMNKRPPVFVSAPRFFSHGQQVRDGWSRELLGHPLPVSLRARGRRCYSGRHRS